jgi:hypothetical protein
MKNGATAGHDQAFAMVNTSFFISLSAASISTLRNKHEEVDFAIEVSQFFILNSSFR